MDDFIAQSDPAYIADFLPAYMANSTYDGQTWSIPFFVLTQGGPAGASTVLLYYLWEQRFEFLNVGIASALTVVLIAVLLVFTLTNFMFSERKEDAHVG